MKYVHGLAVKQALKFYATLVDIIDESYQNESSSKRTFSIHEDTIKDEDFLLPWI